MLLLPIPDADGIAKTKEIVFNRTGHTPTDEEAAKLLGGVMRYLYLLRRQDEQLRTNWQGPLQHQGPLPDPKPTRKVSATKNDADSMEAAEIEGASQARPTDASQI